MSNSWHYPILFDDDHPITEELLAKVFSILATLGYSFWISSEKTSDGFQDDDQEIPSLVDAVQLIPEKIRLMQLDGMEEREFCSADEVIHYLVESGGGVTLWKNQGQMDIWICIVPEENEVSLGAPYALRKDDEDRAGVAIDLKKGFHEICLQLNPFYGYSVDDYGLETMFQKDFSAKYEEFCSAFRQMKHPPVLFWMNYFSAAYLQKLGRLDMWKTSAIVEERKEGVFIYLADQPWNEVFAFRQAEGYYSLPWNTSKVPRLELLRWIETRSVKPPS